MMFTSLRRWFQKRKVTTYVRPESRFRARPRVEQLEDRVVPTTALLDTSLPTLTRDSALTATVPPVTTPETITVHTTSGGTFALGGGPAILLQVVATDSLGLASPPAFVSVQAVQSAGPPSVSAQAAPPAVLPGHTVQLTATPSDPNTGAGLSLSFVYQWQVVSRPAGSAATLSDPTLANPTITPDVAGIYQLQVVATDSLGLASPPAFVSVQAATPETITVHTTSGGNITLGAGPAILTDTAIVSGSAHGILVFALSYNLDFGGPSSTFFVEVGAQTITTGGTYSASIPIADVLSDIFGGTPIGKELARVGLYTWHVHFFSSNTKLWTGADDQGTPAEQQHVYPAIPSLTTKAHPDITLGTRNVTLTDTATLSGAYLPTGTITFTLTYNGNPVSGVVGATQTVSANPVSDLVGAPQNDPNGANGSYAASYMLPTDSTVVGTYVWTAHYSGNVNNKPAHDQGGSREHVVVSAASPTLDTHADSTSPIAGQIFLHDSATLSGGYFPTGTITFTLHDPDGTAAGTQTLTVNANATNGTYSTTTAASGSFQATTTGVYWWSTVYVSGNGNNNGAGSNTGNANDENLNEFTTIGAIGTGGMARGFWQNHNGQSLITQAYFTDLNTLSLRSATGALVQFTGDLAQNKKDLAAFLKRATAENMANMLSAQLAATELNVLTGKAHALDYVDLNLITSRLGRFANNAELIAALNNHVNGNGRPTSNGIIQIQSIIDWAKSVLGTTAGSVTVAGRDLRAFEEALKCVLQNINNNARIILNTLPGIRGRYWRYSG